MSGGTISTRPIWSALYVRLAVAYTPYQPFALLTTAANDTARPIHDRSRFVEPGDWSVWLDEEGGNAAGLLRPADDNILRAWPISGRVNSPANNDVGLLDAV